MIFMRYESFQAYLRMYPVTSLLLALNLVLFLLLEFSGGSTNSFNLYRFGAFVHGPGDPLGLEEPWRYITSQFLHIGWMHLLFNCFSLLVFAPPLERLLGSVRYLVFYLLCGVGGNAMSAIVGMDAGAGVLSAGASGAIYGIFGAYLHIVLLRKHLLDPASRQTVIVILIIGLIYSLVNAQINLEAHIGGAIAGFALYRLFGYNRRW